MTAAYRTKWPVALALHRTSYNGSERTCALSPCWLGFGPIPPRAKAILMSQYSRPTLTDLGQVEDLTQITISVKLAKIGTDIHISKNGISPQSGPGVHKGVTIGYGA